MGDVNSGTHFQNFMERKFQGENPYIDDLSCADKQFPEHLTRLRKIFEICEANDIVSKEISFQYEKSKSIRQSDGQRLSKSRR